MSTNKSIFKTFRHSTNVHFESLQCSIKRLFLLPHYAETENFSHFQSLHYYYFRVANSCYFIDTLLVGQITYFIDYKARFLLKTSTRRSVTAAKFFALQLCWRCRLEARSALFFEKLLFVQQSCLIFQISKFPDFFSKTLNFGRKDFLSLWMHSTVYLPCFPISKKASNSSRPQLCSKPQILYLLRNVTFSCCILRHIYFREAKLSITTLAPTEY